MPGPLAPIAATGVATALVVDVGAEETRVLPVADARPLFGAMKGDRPPRWATLAGVVAWLG